MSNTTPISRSSESILATNKVLRSTYALLSMTLLFSAAMAVVSMYVGMPRGAAMICTFAGIGLMMFVLPRFQNSSAGIGLVFLCTGLLGLGIGPMIAAYLSYPNGPATVATAMAGTGGIFLALSGYVLTTKKDFSFMGGFLMVGLIVLFGAIILSLFTAMPALNMAISAGMILLMSGFLLFDTSRIINGGETNYIRATTSLFINIFNIFTSLLHLLGVMGDD